MFIIEEKKSVKLPALTSLFFTLPTFNKDLIDIFNQLDVMNYDAKSKTYELPISKLFLIVSSSIKFYDVEFRPYHEKPVK